MTFKERYKKERAAYDALMKWYPFTLEDLDGEQWADIQGYAGLYQISTFGRVKSFTRWPNGKILHPLFAWSGYLAIELWENSTAKKIGIHQLVARCFISNPANKMQVDHIDGHPMNNHVSNLRWATPAENTRYAYDLGLGKSGTESYQAKLTNEQVIYIRENPENLTQSQLATKFGVIQATISAVQLGQKYKNAGGQIHNLKVQRIPDEVRAQIRAEYVRGSSDFGTYGLAKKYGFCHETIRRIVNEK